jgi:predicted ATPase
MEGRRIKELRLMHFKAFEDARLPLDDLTVLVGRNGSGKSTLIDALEFIKTALSSSLSRAVERAGGISDVRQRQGGRGAPFDISLAVLLEVRGEEFLYGFRFGPRKSQEAQEMEFQWVVKEEELKSTGRNVGFRRTQTTFKTDLPKLAPKEFEPDALVLPLMAGANKDWTSVSRAIRSIQCYNISPEGIRAEPPIASTSTLERDGRNTGDFLKTILQDPESKEWLLSRLQLILPGLVNVSSDAFAGRRRIHFEQQGRTDTELYDFTGRNMSDGTLRALGILVALLKRPSPMLLAVDEVDDSLHPHAIQVLLGALANHTDRSQILVTTHDVELLSQPAIIGTAIRLINWDEGISRIYRLKKKVIDAINPINTVGEFLRTNSLFPEASPLANGADFWTIR